MSKQEKINVLLRLDPGVVNLFERLCRKKYKIPRSIQNRKISKEIEQLMINELIKKKFL